jgi:YD repeat-containing protein
VSDEDIFVLTGLLREDDLDAAGNRLQEQVLNPSGTVVKGVTRAYSPLGRLISLTDGLNRVIVDASVSGSYDGNGNLVQSLDGLGVQTKASYDGLNRLIGAIQDAGGKSSATHNTQTVTQYDVLDRIEGISDPEGLATTYARNAFGDVLDQVSPDTGHSSAGFDAAGNATASTDARGTSVSYTYDALDRRTSATYPVAADNVSWRYDEPDSVTGCVGSASIGRMTRVIDAASTTTYCYDKRGNVWYPKGGKQDTGTWASDASDDVASHEAGHLLHLGDRYHDVPDPTNRWGKRSIPDPGYENNIMSNSRMRPSEADFFDIMKNKLICH